MAINVCVFLPIAKKTWNINTLASFKHIDIYDAVDYCQHSLGDILDTLIMQRMNHNRPYKRLPRYLKFILMHSGNPRYHKSSKIGEFHLFLDGEPPKIVSYLDWIRPQTDLEY
jgi:hypothetical protein